MKNIILTGGGTMGHVSPNLALIPILTQNFKEVHYIGSSNGIERTKIEELKNTFNNLYYHAIPSTKLNRKNIFKNLAIPFILFRAFKASTKLIKKIKPCAVFSKGGYVSVPVVLRAQKLNIPTIIHESDLSMGLANKLASKKATTICTTFRETAKKFANGVATGSPVSSSLLNANKNDAINEFNLNTSLKTITITGGSLGSEVINNAIEKILPSLVKKYNIIHLTGKGKSINFKHPNYHQTEFSSMMGSIFKASDLVISRAGSNTIFELALLKKPMILIPLSKKASRGDQIENALYFKNLKIAEVVFEENLNGLENVLEETINNLDNLKSNLIKQNLSGGLENLVKEIYKAIKKNN